MFMLLMRSIALVNASVIVVYSLSAQTLSVVSSNEVGGPTAQNYWLVSE